MGLDPGHKQVEVCFSLGAISEVSGLLKVRQAMRTSHGGPVATQALQVLYSWDFQRIEELLPGSRGWGKVGLTFQLQSPKAL